MPIRVLVADDFPLMRDGISRALDGDARIQVVATAASGDEAVQRAGDTRPDVMLIDLHMSAPGGVAILEAVTQALPDTRVIIISDSDKPETFLDAIAAGAAGYLPKDTSAEDLREAVATVHAGGPAIDSSLMTHLVRDMARAEVDSRPGSVRALAAREREVLRFVALGLTDAEIGRRLFISARTVQNDLRRTRERTGLRRRSELARWAVEHALVSRDDT